jgi:hypothetical protein
VVVKHTVDPGNEGGVNALQRIENRPGEFFANR